MSHAFDRVQGVRADLNRVLLERTQAVDNALLALLTRQHYLQISRQPGTAKSLLVDALHARIMGAKRFKCFFTPATTADELLGPPDLLALADHGKHQRVHARSLAEADFAFLDEIGRGNALVYATLLQLLGEERTVDELGMDAPLRLPLMSVFGASNAHLIGDKTLEALNNRFLLREEIVPLQERVNLITLATKPPRLTDVQATMTLDELRQAQAEAQTVSGTAEVLEASLELREALREASVIVTDRMWTWSFPLMKAHAWLHGESEMTLEDLGVLAAAWWEDPKDKQGVQRAIYAVSNPLQQRALEIEDDAMDLVKNLPHEDDPDFVSAGDSVNVQLRDMQTTLMQAIRQSRARDKRQAVASLQRINSAHQKFGVAYAKRTHLGHIDISAVLTTA